MVIYEAHTPDTGHDTHKLTPIIIWKFNLITLVWDIDTCLILDTPLIKSVSATEIVILSWQVHCFVVLEVWFTLCFICIY